MSLISLALSLEMAYHGLWKPTPPNGRRCLPATGLQQNTGQVCVTDTDCLVAMDQLIGALTSPPPGGLPIIISSIERRPGETVVDSVRLLGGGSVPQFFSECPGDVSLRQAVTAIELHSTSASSSPLVWSAVIWRPVIGKTLR